MPHRSMTKILPSAVVLLLLLAGCSTYRESNAARTATEQLLISTAADKAAEKLVLPIPPGSKIFIDTTNFDTTADAKYAVATIHDRLLKAGNKIAANRGSADIVVEIRAGALSEDDHQTLVGIPQFNVPIPLAGGVTFPELALFKIEERQGVAKFAAIAFDAKDGGLVGAAEPEFGYSHRKRWKLLLFFSWTTNDLVPEEKSDPDSGLTLP
jgi:hypothetical protein